MNTAWIYYTATGQWQCARTGRVGCPAPGDTYLDGDEWRVW